MRRIMTIKRLYPILIAITAIWAGCAKDEESTVTDAQTTINPPSEGFLPAYFSVSEGKQVRFAKGNLQYSTTGSHATADGTQPGTWRFADKQTDFIGDDNLNASETYTGWIDCFGWGTSGYHDEADSYCLHYMPYSTTEECAQPGSDAYKINLCGYGPSINQADTALTAGNRYYDWGVYNAISNGGNQPGQWRTLTVQEWNYLLTARKDAANLNALATVNGQKGAIILPDGFELPDGLSFTAGPTGSYTANVYTTQQWEQLEQAGAVFLPACGLRSKDGMSSVGMCHYWTASASDYTAAYALRSYNYSFETRSTNLRYNGYCVRLVTELKPVSQNDGKPLIR
ncbi:MAG: hypothetical protein KBT04_02080 [Bacteroidales bacterium]|nr:hypothetical protein [Candidatus Colimorpha onthohippi]